MHRSIFTLATATALLMTGCATSGAVHDEFVTTVPSHPNGAELLDTLAPHLPADIDAVAVVNMRRMHDHHMPTAFGLIEKEWDSAPMLAEMQALYREHLGLDLTQVDTAFVAFHDDDFYTFLFGKIEGPTTEGTPRGELVVWTSPQEEHLKIAQRKGVDAWILTQENGIDKMVAGDRLAGTEQHERLRRLLARAGNADLVVAGSSSHVEEGPSVGIPIPDAADMLKDGPGGGAVAISDRFVVVVQGNTDELGKLQATFDEAIEKFRASIRTDTTATPATPHGAGTESMPMESFGAAFGKIWAYHLLGALQNEISPAIEGDLMVWNVRTTALTHPVTISMIVGGIVWAFTSALGSFSDLPAAAPTPAVPAPPTAVPPAPPATSPPATKP